MTFRMKEAGSWFIFESNRPIDMSEDKRHIQCWFYFNFETTKTNDQVWEDMSARLQEFVNQHPDIVFWGIGDAFPHYPQQFTERLNKMDKYYIWDTVTSSYVQALGNNKYLLHRENEKDKATSFSSVEEAKTAGTEFEKAQYPSRVGYVVEIVDGNGDFVEG